MLPSPQVGQFLRLDAESLEMLWEFRTRVKPRNIVAAELEALSAIGHNESDWGNASVLHERFGAYYFRLDHTMIFTSQNVLLRLLSSSPAFPE
jgi:hypothetical protein